MTGAVVQAISNFLLALAAFLTQLGMKIGREQEREKILEDSARATEQTKSAVQKAVADFRQDGSIDRMKRGVF